MSICVSWTIRCEDWLEVVDITTTVNALANRAARLVRKHPHRCWHR